MNKTFLMGNLGRDVEVKYTQGGTAVAKFSIADNERYKDRNGQVQERVNWFEIDTFGKQAEACGNHLSKGSRVLVEGSLRQENWDGKDGKKHYAVKVVAQRVHFLGSKGDSGQAGSGRSGGDDGGFGGPPDDEDIPF